MDATDLTRMQVPVGCSDQHGDTGWRCMHRGGMQVDGADSRGGHRCP